MPGVMKGGNRERKSAWSPSAASYNRSLRKLGSDDKESFRLNAVAAESGMHDAILAMGWFYRNGIGVETDAEAARSWWKKSARQGEPRAMFSLGQLAEEEADYGGAMMWYRRAAEHGHSRSLYWIGKLYWRGQGVAKDQKLATSFFQKAAQKREQEAQRALRFLHYCSRGK